ncbi:MAG: hypothetical protein K6E20_00705, partial [Acholeplasmatales bacterium]|nr:hypothetical protein [Acholeplasmatales bacterium]
DNEVYSFSLNINDFNLYPYFTVNDDNISIIVNIKKTDSSDELYKNINDFNLKSKYFTAKYKDKILYLEYNFYAVNDNVVDILDSCISSLNNLGADIDKF